MALPVILVNSSSGSDTNGGTGGTAISGSAAATSSDGLTVTLDGSPDLSGVPTDGSVAIFLNDSTAGARNFGKITAKDNTAKTVTVANAFGLSLSGKAWSIGGKRASIGSTTSRKLFENNSAAGDAMPGWAAEMESGHAETLSATLTFRRSGDDTDGAITLRGTSGAATPPVVTFSNNGNAFQLATNVTRVTARDFEVRNTNATKTASVAFALASGGSLTLLGMKASHATNFFWRGVSCSGTTAGSYNIRKCEFGYCADSAVSVTSNVATTVLNLRRNRIHHCGTGMSFNPTSGLSASVIGNEIFANTGDGINRSSTGNAANCGLVISRNTFYGNGSDAIEIAYAAAGGLLGPLEITDNILAGSTGYGLNLSGTSMTAVAALAAGALVAGNTANNNTAGACNLAGVLAGGSTSDPQFVDAANGNFSIGANVRGTGYSTESAPFQSYRSYEDPGANQPDSSGAGSSTDPGQANVLAGTAYTINGVGKTGTRVEANANYYLTSGAGFGDPGSLTSGKATLPAAGDVDSTAAAYGVFAALTTPTCVLPAIVSVLSPTQYGAGGTEFTGTASGGGGSRAYILGD